MRNAETVLTIIRERGKRGLPLEDVYHMLYNPDLYLRAYARLYKNKGAMTRGVTDETVDAMSLTKINQLIDDVRHERHRWTPVRRVYIAKKKACLWIFLHLNIPIMDTIINPMSVNVKGCGNLRNRECPFNAPRVGLRACLEDPMFESKASDGAG